MAKASVGGRVRALRLERGFTLVQMEEAAGISAGNLSRIERGTQGVTEDVIYRLAEALAVHPSALFMDGTSKLPATRDQQKWLELIDQLCEFQRDELLMQLTDTATRNSLIRGEVSRTKKAGK
jgi:transcriptional regulator with XRE-family HTH domain